MMAVPNCFMVQNVGHVRKEVLDRRESSETMFMKDYVIIDIMWKVIIRQKFNIRSVEIHK